MGITQTQDRDDAVRCRQKPSRRMGKVLNGEKRGRVIATNHLARRSFPPSGVSDGRYWVFGKAGLIDWVQMR